MSKFEFKRGKGFKVDDTFFKDNFDITGIEDNIYNQIAKTMARNVDIDLAKTPLVDILTGYTRYKEAEYELQQKENIIKEVREWAKKYSCQFTNDDGELVVSEISFNIQARPCDLFKILDKGE